MKQLLLSILALSFIIACTDSESAQQNNIEKASVNVQQNMATHKADTMEKYEIQKSEEEWRELLTSKEYRILRGRGTELPYVNEYYNNKKEGVYYCAACGQPVFTSETKYESGTGWPSFWDPIKLDYIGEQEDNSLFMTRTETVCARCGSHLGHVFEDGPEPTGLRYCLNSAALDFAEMNLDTVDVKELPVREKIQ